MREIHLIRHGRSAAPFGVMIGKADPPLSREGLLETTHLAESLAAGRAGSPIDYLFCSPLARARQTAQIVGERLNLVPSVWDDLREIDLGLFDGLTAAQAKKNYPDAWDGRGADLYRVPPPGGESYADLGARVLTAFDDILKSHVGNLALASHRAVIQVILARERDLPPWEAPKITVAYAEAETVWR